MNPLRLRATNYRSFSDLDVTIPEGCTAVVGPNGAGKSSIVGAIDLCLFGSRSLGDYLTEGVDLPMQLELEFEHRGELYRVRRSYSPKGRGQTRLDFECFTFHEGGALDPRDWRPLTRETAAATQSLIEETLGLSRETFRASAFLAQGDGAAFTEAQPRERKAILAEVLGLGIWDELLKLAKADHGKLAETLQRLMAELELALGQLSMRPLLEAKKTELGSEVESLVDTVAKGEDEKQRVGNEIAAAGEARAANEAARERLAEREATLARTTARKAALVEKLKRAEDLRREHNRLTSASADVVRLQRELDEAIEAQRQKSEYERLSLERQRLIGEATELNQRASNLAMDVDVLRATKPDATACERCGQQLGYEALQKSIATMREQAWVLGNEAEQRALAADRVDLPKVTASPGRPLDAIQSELTRARTDERRLIEVKTELAGMEEAANELNDLVGEEKAQQRAVDEARAAGRELNAKLPDLRRLEARLAEVQQALDAGRRLLDRARADLAVVESKLHDLADLAHKTEGTEAGLRAIQAELDVVLLAERAYGRDGIPALIVENAAIPQIETEANRILAELGTSFTVELHTQRELKSGEGLKESLDIVVAGPIGARPYETFSGGERTRLNLALRIALARLLAHRRGAEVRMLAIDEPEFLDEAGVARLAEVLRSLSADFDRILLVSHVPGLRDAFDQAIEVEKVGERSRLVGEPEREAVAA